ncbi:cell wall-active antibiotics response protein LiaF [Virgibacillus halophilus]|uniref:cell wall-active antibiotics response protein LiaF n=1 Tax=Tigheibacillus halophilus TaxID=361280 RepID=UPI003631AA1C
MFDRLSTDRLNWILIIGVILFLVEISFFHGGMIIPALFSACMVYIGYKHFRQLWGKILFWIGAIIFVFSVLNLLAVRFLLIAAIVWFVLEYWHRKKEADYIQPTIEMKSADEEVYEVAPLFDLRLFGTQKTSDHAYKWNDINIHGGIGDRIIDLSNTVLPGDTAVISIRHLSGNIEILVPYEVEVCIHHSVVFGRFQVFGKRHRKLANQTVTFKTENYDQKGPRVKIVTSLFSGDIEVRRI